MLRTLFHGCFLSVAFALLAPATTAVSPSGPQLPVTTIINKNVAARGGLPAWRSVQTMSLQGKLGAGGNRRPTVAVPGATGAASKEALGTRPAEEVFLPFLMELKRPHKMRFELEFKGQTALQVYDGTNGWKLRPFLGRRVVEPYTSDELRVSSIQADLDGPLVDYAAKGTHVELQGVEKVEDRDAYKVKLTLSNGQITHVWIDCQTFLEAKIEGQPRRLDGVQHQVEVYFGDYRNVNGLQIPFLLDTRVLPLAGVAAAKPDRPFAPSEKTIIEKVTINPKLEETLFSKPEVQVASNVK